MALPRLCRRSGLITDLQYIVFYVMLLTLLHRIYREYNQDTQHTISERAVPDTPIVPTALTVHGDKSVREDVKNASVTDAPMASVTDAPMAVNMSRGELYLAWRLAEAADRAYVISERRPCLGSPQIMITVMSHPEHFSQRRLIRATWATLHKYRDIKIRIVFLLGMPGNKAWDKARLMNESRRYRDMVQDDFIDTYRNRTLKGVLNLRWLTKECTDPIKLYVKVNDHVFINTYRLLEFYQANIENKDKEKTIYCNVKSNVKPLRSQGKYAVTSQEFSGDVYPPHCANAVYMMTQNMPALLYERTIHVPPFWIESIYITGLLPPASNGTMLVNLSQQSKHNLVNDATGNTPCQDFLFMDFGDKNEGNWPERDWVAFWKSCKVKLA